MIRDILLLQKRELKKKLSERYIDRKLDPKKFSSQLIKAITGPRRVGKSFAAIHTLNKLGSFGYANFDDERLVELKNYDEIIDNLNQIYEQPKYLLFDEVQNLDKWELFVNRLQRQGYNLIITGSNSKLLSKELATHLTGRHWQINIFPFSFREFLQLEEQELTQSEIKARLSAYLVNGGYPEPLVKKMDVNDYLSILFNSILYKDIVKRFKIRSPQAIEDLAVFLLSNTAKEFSYRTLSQLTKCKSVHTVEKYLNYLEESFMFFRLNKFSFKFKEQAESNKKIYCVDNGLISAKAFKLSPDFGKLYENLVAIELKKREINGNIKLYYWKNPQQEEVDFVVKENLKIKQLIQVCCQLNNSKVKEREFRALLKAGRELKCQNLLVITEDEEKEEIIKWFDFEGKVKLVPLWKWLITEEIYSNGH